MTVTSGMTIHSSALVEIVDQSMESRVFVKVVDTLSQKASPGNLKESRLPLGRWSLLKVGCAVTR